MKKILLFTFINICAVSTLKAQTCQQLPTCESLGFSKTIAQCANLNYIKCPFDNSMVYCLDEEYPLSACPTGGNCSTITKHKLNSCQNSYELSSDGLTCNACNFTNYPLSSCDANGTCSNYTCGNVTKYKLDSCNSGYTQSGNTCVNNNPCAGYYECGGEWQYCEGYTCSADSNMCSEFCERDYFPNECEDESYCDGVYRNGYCSGYCECFPDNCSNYPFEEKPIEGDHGTVYDCVPGCGLPTRYKLVCDIHSELIGNECVECVWEEGAEVYCPSRAICEEVTCGGYTRYYVLECEDGYHVCTQTDQNGNLTKSCLVDYIFNSHTNCMEN